jgi:CheY-like chemotaxis protein
MGTDVLDELCVLVVDDDDGVRETLRDVVEMAGCSVILAASGEEALRVLATHRPCLIVLDLMMPTMNGLEVLQTLHATPALASLPVLISTSAPALAPAGTPVLSKPIDIPALWAWMRRTCHCSRGISWNDEASRGVTPTKGKNGELPT